MSLTHTKEIELGYELPNLSLPEPFSGKTWSFQNLQGPKGMVVIWMCNHCPYVIHVVEELVRVAHDYLPKGIGFVGVNSNDVVGYPADSPEKMVDFVKQYQLPFPYLFDEDQKAAQAFLAECTPDISMFDANGKCVYRGRLDESTPGNDKPKDGKDLRMAMDALLEGKSIPSQFPSMGCNIKWK